MFARTSHRSKIAFTLAAATQISLCSCGAGEGVDSTDPTDPTDDTGAAHGAQTTVNALTANALTANALTANALTANALTANALTANALTANALTAKAIGSDPAARMVLKYIVGCALPEGAHLDLEIDGQSWSFDGSIGLAPDWGKVGGHCDATCRGWVSGCVLSRLNYLGKSVPLSIRGSTAALASSKTERTQYPHREATYYGDIFASPQVRLGCLSPGATTDHRVCGPSIKGCVVKFAGSCDEACDPVKADGSFPNCRDHVRDAHDHFPAGTKTFKDTVTVFLK
jgi:hypothetical protein